MASEASATSGPTLTGSVGKLFFSTMRLSGAATLYGVQQLEAAASVLEDEDGISRQMDRFGATVESLTSCLTVDISPGKKEALESISTVTGRVVRQTLEVARFLDPREVLRVANNLAHRSSETMSGWMGKKEPVPDEAPKLAVDVLGN
jgi:hypothetical protein